MLKAEKLAFRYSQKAAWVFQDISLTLSPGEIVGLSGPSGCGKTTLGKVLAGYLEPTEGQITLGGKVPPKAGYSPVQLIFQHPELAINPRWRMNQVLDEGFSPSKELLRALGIEPGWLTRWPHELSGGELQRFAVARSLGPGTRYLIADEMTTMLDANTQAQIWQVILTEARQRSLGVLVISHEAPLLKRVCGRVIQLERTN
jgi:ABC-type dipeptide/oligopeptide/nickel transport system ATPase subunit